MSNVMLRDEMSRIRIEKHLRDNRMNATDLIIKLIGADSENVRIITAIKLTEDLSEASDMLNCSTRTLHRKINKIKEDGYDI